MFCYFRDAWYTPQQDESYRWGGAFIQSSSQGYVVTMPHGDKRVVTTLREAAVLVGIDEERILKWKRDFSDLSIVCVFNSVEYVEIWLTGSERVPYGARYISKDRPETLSRLLRSGDQRLEADDTRFVHMTGRWFYFRGKR
jgi:hypothetical protein